MTYLQTGAYIFIMTEEELWKQVQADPSNEALHQQYVNACVKHSFERQAIQRYTQIKNLYPQIANKFIKQLTIALQFKVMPVRGNDGGEKSKKSLLLRLFGLEYSVLITGILSFAYGIIAGSTVQLWIGIVIIVGFMGYKYIRVKHH